MDDADIATEIAQRNLDSAIAAARGIAPRWRTHCIDCGEPLEDHRRPYGICIDCRQAQEHRAATRA